MAALIMCPLVDRTEVDPELEPEQRSCSKCGAGIWVSRSSRELMAQRSCVLICNPCAGPTLAADRLVRAGHPLPVAAAPGASAGFHRELAETVQRMIEQQG
jgi:hypothetical protein